MSWATINWLILFYDIICNPIKCFDKNARQFHATQHLLHKSLRCNLFLGVGLYEVDVETVQLKYLKLILNAIKTNAFTAFINIRMCKK